MMLKWLEERERDFKITQCVHFLVTNNGATRFLCNSQAYNRLGECFSPGTYVAAIYSTSTKEDIQIEHALLRNQSLIGAPDTPHFSEDTSRWDDLYDGEEWLSAHNFSPEHSKK